MAIECENETCSSAVEAAIQRDRTIYCQGICYYDNGMTTDYTRTISLLSALKYPENLTMCSNNLFFSWKLEYPEKVNECMSIVQAGIGWHSKVVANRKNCTLSYCLSY